MESVNNILAKSSFSFKGEGKKKRKHQKKHSENFFKVPHPFEELYGVGLTPSQKYFYVMLCKLSNRFADSDGWFWHTDKEFSTKDWSILGFEAYGFSVSTSKRARKTLCDLKLIETKYGWNDFGNRSGTYYRLLPIKS